MHSLLILALYLVPFVVIGVIVKKWLQRQNVDLSDVRAEGDPQRHRRARFLLGIWRDESRD